MWNRYGDVVEYASVDFDDRWFELYPWDRDGGTLILGTEMDNITGRVIPMLPAPLTGEEDIPF